MPWRLIVALQAPAAAALLPTSFSLQPGPVVSPGCAGGASADEIVVCARPRPADRYRYRTIEGDYADALPRAETKLFGAAKGSIDVASKTLAPGVISNRVMVTLKVPF